MSKKKKVATPSGFRDRIVELRRVPASTLVANEKNWRKHPRAQRDILSGLLDEVGFAGAVIAREVDGELVLIDGHLRASEMGDQEIPVLVTDLTPEEADLVLMTYDPIGSLAGTDQEMLQSILEDVQTTNDAIVDMMADYLARPPFLPDDEIDADGDPTDDDGEPGGSDHDFDWNDIQGEQFVDFRFGDYKGRCLRNTYDAFVVQYKAAQERSGAVMLDDVLRSWLHVG